MICSYGRKYKLASTNLYKLISTLKDFYTFTVNDTYHYVYSIPTIRHVVKNSIANWAQVKSRIRYCSNDLVTQSNLDRNIGCKQYDIVKRLTEVYKKLRVDKRKNPSSRAYRKYRTI
ncbi:hypothetical protein HZH68_015019 [Vespula germanica]|uniref:Uncharacterized protein n=1 Tax=Vespula germanica TaxID=30212 RepID=A0A834J847_VESGE|nr:hypothetical protein HZH68_015019 [Vespula germanica]